MSAALPQGWPARAEPQPDWAPSEQGEPRDGGQDRIGPENCAGVDGVEPLSRLHALSVQRPRKSEIT